MYKSLALMVFFLGSASAQAQEQKTNPDLFNKITGLFNDAYKEDKLMGQRRDALEQLSHLGTANNFKCPDPNRDLLLDSYRKLLDKDIPTIPDYQRSYFLYYVVNSVRNLGPLGSELTREISSLRSMQDRCLDAYIADTIKAIENQKKEGAKKPEEGIDSKDVGTALKAAKSVEGKASVEEFTKLLVLVREDGTDPLLRLVAMAAAYPGDKLGEKQEQEYVTTLASVVVNAKGKNATIVRTMGAITLGGLGVKAKNAAAELTNVSAKDADPIVKAAAKDALEKILAAVAAQKKS